MSFLEKGTFSYLIPKFKQFMATWLVFILHRTIFEKESIYLGNNRFTVAVVRTTGPQPVQTLSQIYNIKLPYQNEPSGN